jgi:uncharacterized repeat protein (TIGR01451 family)
VALLAVAVMAGSSLLGSEKASAHAVPGEYELAVSSPVLAPLGGSFVVDASIDTNGNPAYKAAQWKIDYDQTIVMFTSVVLDGAAPGAACIATSDDGDTTLLGCLDLAPGTGTLTYSGDVWHVTYTCIAPGPTPFTLVETLGATAKTFVKIGTVIQPFHTHDAATQCIPYTDISVEKTGPATVNAGDPIAYVVTATNNGPLPVPAASMVVGDDLPDNLTGVAATLDTDADGDTVYETLAGPCGPGLFAAFPNPFPPPALLLNVVACVNGVMIAPGGSIRANITATVPADACNQTLVNLALGASTDDFGGTLIPDLDLLDLNTGATDADLPAFPGDASADNNFDLIVTQVGDCQITLDKVAPAGGAVGNIDVYTISVTNAGPSNATSVTVTDVVPAGLTVTGVVASGIGDCTATVGNSVSCSWTTIAPGVETITITFTEDAAGDYCNTANATWTRFPSGSASDGPECFTVIPPFNGIVKSVDPDGNDTNGIDDDGDTVVDEPGEGPLPPLVPATGEDTILVNLWLCTDQATDGVDNDGNSTVDDEDTTCDGNGEGELDITEAIFTRADCDTRNDDDDGDGKPVDGSVADGSTTPYVGSNPRPECPQPTLADYNNDLVDKDGGELPEGLGAFEFQVKFDHKVFDIDVTTATAWANGRSVNCSMTLISENDIRVGCVSTGTGLGFAQVSGIAGATLHITADSDMIFRIRPGKDNGVSRKILDENCEVADIYGDIFPFTNAGLTPDCTDIDITMRRLEGDVDADCDVDLQDSQLIAFRYGSFFGQLLYNQIYDLEPFVAGDFDIDIKDLQFVFGRIGSECADPIPDNQDPEAAEGVGQP